LATPIDAILTQRFKKSNKSVSRIRNSSIELARTQQRVNGATRLNKLMIGLSRIAQTFSFEDMNLSIA
jgi:hypothetical protein